MSNYFYSSIRYTILRLSTSLLFSFLLLPSLSFCSLIFSLPFVLILCVLFYFLFRVSKHVILNLLIIITLMTMMMQEIACSLQEHKKDLNCNILWGHNCSLIVLILIIWFYEFGKFCSDSGTVVLLKCSELFFELFEILWINNLKKLIQNWNKVVSKFKFFRQGLNVVMTKLML